MPAISVQPSLYPSDLAVAAVVVGFAAVAAVVGFAAVAAVADFAGSRYKNIL